MDKLVDWVEYGYSDFEGIDKFELYMHDDAYKTLKESKEDLSIIISSLSLYDLENEVLDKELREIFIDEDLAIVKKEDLFDFIRKYGNDPNVYYQFCVIFGFGPLRYEKPNPEKIIETICEWNYVIPLNKLETAFSHLELKDGDHLFEYYS